jgi:hypothetical protein
VRGMDAELEPHGCVLCVSCQQDTGTETPRVMDAEGEQ